MNSDRGDRRGNRWSSWVKSPLLWFLLISLIAHHALIMSVVEVPDTSYYETFDVDLVKGDAEDDDLLVEKHPVVPPEVRTAEIEPQVVPEKRKKPEKEQIPEPEEEKKQEPEPEPEEKDAPEPIPEDLPPLEGLHFVDIDSFEADEPPEDAKYFAPINSQVDEEMVAENTNLDEDQGQSTPETGGDPAETPGSSEEHLAAHLVDEDTHPLEDAPKPNDPQDPKYATTTPQPSASSVDKPEGKLAEKSTKSDPQEPVPLTPDNAPPLKLALSEDGEFYDPETGEIIPTLAEAKKKAEDKKGGKKGGDEPKLADLDLSYTDIDGMLGAEMAEMQEQYAESKKNKQKGGFTENIGKVFSQLENFVSDVKPGNQTALNAAYHPFAEYITAFHRSLHPQWGDGYIASLMSKPNGDPLNDMSLWVKLEFVVLPDGSIEKVTVVKTSGLLVFDVAAIDAIYGGEPYPPPPEVIKSYDGKVYMRWGMYRNHSQCGVWNAEPYILTSAGTKKKKVKPPEEKKAPKKK